MSTTVVAIEKAEDEDDGAELGLPPGAIDGECSGVMWPEPAVLPASISNALNAHAVEREREQPRKT
jgi:hypothetical protein